MVIRRSAWHPRYWDPIVVVPPAAALVAVLAVVLAVTISTERAVPGAGGLVRGMGGWVASSAFAAARPSTPVRPAPHERTVGHHAPAPMLRAEARSPLIVVPASTPSGLRSVQAP